MSSLDIVNTSMMNTDKYIFMAYTCISSMGNGQNPPLYAIEQ